MEFLGVLHMARKKRANTATVEAETSRPLTLPPADVKPEGLDDRELLEMSIAATPDPRKPGRAIPATRFAAEFALCNDRTLRRYLARDNARPLPPLLRERCEAIVRTAARRAAKLEQSADMQAADQLEEPAVPTAGPVDRAAEQAAADDFPNGEDDRERDAYTFAGDR